MSSGDFFPICRIDMGGDVLSGSALRLLSARLREHRRRGLGTRWRRLNAGRQAVLTLAHLRKLRKGLSA
ncbi:hypothetical protein [Streptomyces chattanoogensis]|uniref:hypothetical protein n=1 Tax=Streptomyces chattanoogensis TaxID=66876 RepID=UPI0036A59EA4